MAAFRRYLDSGGDVQVQLISERTHGLKCPHVLHVADAPGMQKQRQAVIGSNPFESNQQGGTGGLYLSMSSKRAMAAVLAHGKTCRMFFIRHRQCSV